MERDGELFVGAEEVAGPETEKACVVCFLENRLVSGVERVREE